MASIHFEKFRKLSFGEKKKHDGFFLNRTNTRRYCDIKNGFLSNG